MRAPGLVPGTEKYFPGVLLGYGFLGRGLTAEVTLKGDRVKAVVIMSDSKEGVTRAFDAYVEYLNESKATLQISHGSRGSGLHGVDPLFKGVVLQQFGQYVIGFTGLKAPRDGDECIEGWLGRLPKE